MLKKINCFIVFILLFGKAAAQDDSRIVVDMHLELNDSIDIRMPLDVIASDLRPFDKYPKFKKHVVETYKGIPVNDSVGYYGVLQDGIFTHELSQLGDISKSDYIALLKKFEIDTLNYSKVMLKQGLVAVIGFYKNKQFIVADANRNKDFSDDIKYEYDINFRNNALADSDFLNKQPITDYTFEKCKDGKIQVYRRRFIIYPDKFYTLRPDNFREKEYLSVLRFRDWWKGKTIINNQKMEFYYQGLSNEYWPIYIKPKETPFTRDDDGFNDQFKHDLKESIRMAGGYYLIDSIAADISKVYLRKIPVTYNKYGNQVGDYLKTTEFKDLNDKAFSTQDIIGKKKFTLLEFWGTWCTPCREMTPVIKKMYKDSPSELNIVSIAVDRDKSAVKQYISKNNMDWKQGWFEHFDNQVLQGLSVHMFPTFILLDAEGKILYKGTTCDTVLGLIR